MKKLFAGFVAAVCACISLGAFAANWTYDSSTGRISDGDWTFRATVSSANLTVTTPVDDTDPSLCPTDVTPLDFSKPVVDAVDPTITYQIVALNTAFYPRGGTKRSSADCVGELTLPLSGLTSIGGAAFRGCSKLKGGVVFPSSLTSVGELAFSDSGVESADFKAATATLSGNYQRGAFYACGSLKWIRFAKEGRFSLVHNGHHFYSCAALEDADLSGVLKVTCSKNSYALFGGCSALTNVTLSSDLCLTNSTTNPSKEGTVGNALFDRNTKLSTIRFTGPAPNEMPYWISEDSGFLGVFGNSQSITTIIPTEYRNIKNDNDMSWEDYSATGSLNINDSTWAAGYVKSGVMLSNRKLLLDKVPEDEAPTISEVVASDIWTNCVTVTVEGGGLKGGTISVSLTNSLGVVTGPLAIADFGESCTFNTLAAGEDYSVIVVATNDKGSSTNSATAFRTVGVTTLAPRALYTSADTTLTFYYDNIERSPLGTVYEVGDGSGQTWAVAIAASVTKVVFDSEFKKFRPVSCAEWFNQCTKIASFVGMEYLDTSEVTSMEYMFRGVNAPKVFDISTFRTANLKNTTRMFYYCGGVTNILANENFITKYINSGSDMFKGCDKLVGGNGSTIDDVGFTAGAARVDREGMPGLFAYKDPVITAKPTILECRLHAGTTEGISLHLVGMDLGSSGSIKLTVHPASDPSAVTAVFYPVTYCDFAMTGLAANTSYLLDVEVENSAGKVKLPQMTFKTKRISPAGYTPKVVFDDAAGTMTFYFDDLPHTEFGAENVYEVSETNTPWSARNTITNAVFDSSFAAYYPVYCKYWFFNFGQLKAITNIENLNTEDVKNFGGMFRQAYALKTLDISGFNTSSATKMDEMFRNMRIPDLDLRGFDVSQVTTFDSMFWGTPTITNIDISTWNTSLKKPSGANMFNSCGKLTTIYANDKVVFGSGSAMFTDCSSLVGGKGTVFDSNFTGHTYARLDGGPLSDTPGYFTEKTVKVNHGLIIFFR